MSPLDHRTRVANEKRERMRMRLIESALHVFASKGADAAVIEDVIAAADVSRGTFYNYFRTNDELMAAVVAELGDELLALIEAVVIERRDPAERLATGVRMMLHTMQAHPLLARFVARAGAAMTTGGSLAMAYVPRDVEAGRVAGQFTVSSAELGVMVVLGMAHAAITGLVLHPGLPATLPEEVVGHMLLALGMPRADAHKLATAPIQPVAFPPDSLLAKTQPTHTANAG